MSAGRRTADGNIAALVHSPGPVPMVKRPLTRIAYPRPEEEPLDDLA